MGRNAQRRRLERDPRAALAWLREHRLEAVEAAMARMPELTLEQANAFIEGMLNPRAPRQAPTGLGARLKSYLLGLPLIGALVETRRG